MGALYTDPGHSAEVASVGTAPSYTFQREIRYFKAPRNGLLKVDMLGVGTSIQIPVVQGTNAERISKVYYSLNTMQVVGFY